MDREDIKYSLKTFGSLVAVTLLNFFICLSILFICTSVFTENIGYNNTVYDKDQNVVAEYTHYNESGEDAEALKYPEDDGFVHNKQNIRSEISKKGNVIFVTVTQTFTLIVLIGFVYPTLWGLGSKDSNRVKFNRKKADNLRGLKIGLAAKIPAVLILLAFLIFGGNLQTKLYGLVNSTYFPIVDIIGADILIKDLSVLRILGLFAIHLIVPAVATVAYLLGFKDISLTEKVIYKSKKKGN